MGNGVCILPNTTRPHIIVGNCLETLKQIPTGSIQCVVTSPPYWGLRNYGTNPQIWDAPQERCDHMWGDDVISQGQTGGSGEASPIQQNRSEPMFEDRKSQFCVRCGAWRGELGGEPTPQLYVRHLVQIFEEVKRVLRYDGVLWLNLGDSYVGGGRGGPDGLCCGENSLESSRYENGQRIGKPTGKIPGLKPKDMAGIPWRVALALQDAGWWLRSDIIWAKPNPMPESVTDRPTKAHEYIFLLSKSKDYYYDNEAVKEPYQTPEDERFRPSVYPTKSCGANPHSMPDTVPFGERFNKGGRNRRSVWTIATQPTPEAHFACVDQETECLTAEGWKRYDEIKIGELAAQFDIETGLLSWAAIEDIASYEVTNQEMIVALNRDMRLMLTPNHRTIIQRRHPRTRQYQKPIVIRADGLKASHAIPVAAPWEKTGNRELSNEWSELLGWYIAEGYECKQSLAVEIYQSETVNHDYVERIKYLLERIGAEWVMAKTTRMYHGQPTTSVAFRIKGYAALHLREIAPQKVIPKSILLWDEDSIEAFLNGIVCGDGSIRTDGRLSFIQKSKETADMVQALVIRTGRCACTSPRMAPGGLWTVYITKHLTRGFRGTNGKGSPPQRVKYTGIIWCPKLPKGTWVARRQGRPFITGNTYPEELVEVCLKAGTSQRGACAKCGAPWERVIEHISGKHNPYAAIDQRLRCNTMSGGIDSTTLSGEAGYNQTLGWRSTCSCGVEETVPCICMDIFGGSGTTGLVAMRLGRRSILLELKEEYTEIMRKRLFSGASALESFIPPAGKPLNTAVSDKEDGSNGTSQN